MKKLFTVALLALNMSASATDIIKIQVSRLYLIDSTVRTTEFNRRAKIKSDQESKGYTFTGVKTINGKEYLTFGK